MKFTKLSIIIPIYNEADTILECLKRIEKVDLGIQKEIILINDGSTDSTAKTLNACSRYTILTHQKNQGKSQAVKRGLLASTGDLAVINDADLEYDPRDLKKFVDLFQKTDVDVVYGNRFGRKENIIYTVNWFGNTFLSFMSWMFTRLGARDVEVCYKMARGSLFRDVAKELKSTSPFGFEVEATARFAKTGVKFKQVSVSYSARTKQDGKHLNIYKDGFKAFWEIIKFSFSK